MKKNLLLIAVAALVGIATLTFNNLHAQNDQAPPGAPPSGQAPPENRPGPPPGFRGRGDMMYRRAIMVLRQTKMQLERSKDDFDGHRQSAMDACEKAVHELEAVQAAIQAAAKSANPPQQSGVQPPAAPAAPGNPPPNQ